MRIGTLVLLSAPLGTLLGNAVAAPFPGPGGNPALDLLAYHDPEFHRAIAVRHYAAPGIATLLAGSLVSRSGESGSGLDGDPRAGASCHADPCRRTTRRHRSWSASSITRPCPARASGPLGFSSPETGIYAGVLIVGAVGSGKTSTCMYPFAQLLLSWQANRPERRVGTLILERETSSATSTSVGIVIHITRCSPVFFRKSRYHSAIGRT